MPVTTLRRYGSKSLLILPLLLLLAFPSVSIRGASDGLLLWYSVVLPSLLPFLICTQMIAAFDGIRLLLAPVYPAIRRIFGFCPESAYTLLCGLICGYPVGARLCSMFYEQGRLPEREARTLLAICNHPSPMFLLGYVARELPVPVSPAILLLSVYLPVYPLYRIAAACYGFRTGSRCDSSPDGLLSGAAGQPSEARPGPEAALAGKETTPVAPAGKEAAPAGKQNRLDAIILSSCESMILIGGYIMLFSILAAWIAALPGLPVPAKALLAAVLEMTTGIHAVCLALPSGLAIPAALSAASFGGLSGLFQTKSVLADDTPQKAGSLIRHRFPSRRPGLGSDYLGFKILHACLTAATAAALLRVLPPALR